MSKNCMDDVASLVCKRKCPGSSQFVIPMTNLEFGRTFANAAVCYLQNKFP